MTPAPPRLALATAAIGILLIAIFAVVLVRSRNELRAEIHQKIIDRAATILYPMAEAQLEEAGADPASRNADPATLLSTVLRSMRQEGMLAVTIFGADGNTLQAMPASLILAELPPGDYPRLLGGEHLSRYHPDFALDQYFSGSSGLHRPVLEVLLPLHVPGNATRTVGFVQYYILAEALAGELDAIDHRINGQTAQALAIGGSLVAIVLTAGYGGLRRAQRIIAERNDRLARTQFELTLAAKTSALGLITSHLIHGLQGPVAGLRSVLAGRRPDAGGANADWESAAVYTERMQAMIEETVALLGDAGLPTTYDLTGGELADIIRLRSAGAAAAKCVVLAVGSGFVGTLDSHRGGLLCLIATNLIQNAIGASPAGCRVAVALTRDALGLTLTVTDQGAGIPEAVRRHLFEPGRSGREGGSGLGLAISKLLATQIGATLVLAATGPAGTTFRLSLPGTGKAAP